MRRLSPLGAAWRDRRGAVAVEFALIVPFLVLLAIGIYDYGAFTVQRGQLAAAARSAAQYALTQADPAKGYDHTTNPVLARTRTLALALAPAGTSTSTASVTYFCQCVTSLGAVVAEPNCVTPTCSPKPVQNYVRVTLTGTYPTTISYPSIPSSLPMSVTATLRRR
jgi:Flp pilus assembly protein TadG